MKTTLLFLSAFFAGIAAALAEPAPAPAAKQGGCACCAAEPDAARKVAGETKTAAGAAPVREFTADSLYQLDARLTDDTGRTFTWKELRGRPVVLTLFFTSCGYACPIIVGDLQAISAKLPAETRARTAFVLVSFDTERDTPAALARFRSERALDQNWTLLHADAGTVRELAALLGVKYKRDADGGFSHSNLITVLNTEGEIVHQRTGLKGGLDEAAAAVTRVAP